jgi:hypothetical protein
LNSPVVTLGSGLLELPKEYLPDRKFIELRQEDCGFKSREVTIDANMVRFFTLSIVINIRDHHSMKVVPIIVVNNMHLWYQQNA